MWRCIDRLPLTDPPNIRIAVRVALLAKAQQAPSRAARSFTALIDTGFSGTFAIREEEVEPLSGVSVGDLWPTRKLPIRSNRGWFLPYSANVWLFKNRPGQPNLDGVRGTILELENGIYVFAKPSPGEPDIRPQSPLIGMQAIRNNDLIVVVDGSRSRVTIRRPWFRFFAS